MADPIDPPDWVVRTELREETRRLRRRAHAIQDVAAAVGSTLHLDEVLEIVLQRITELMEAERSTLFLVDDEGDGLISKIAQGTPQETTIHLAFGDGIAGHVAKSSEALRVDDVYRDPRFDDSWDRATGFRTRSLLCVPMKNQQGRTIGVMEVLNKREGAFTEDDEEMLAALSAPAAVAIENAKLYSAAVARNEELLRAQSRLEQTVRELDALFEVEQEIHRSGDLDGMLEAVLQKTTAVLQAEAGSVLLQAPKGVGDGTLAFRAAVGPVSEQVKRVRLAPGEGIVGWAATQRRPLRVDDVGADERHSRRVADHVGFPVRNELAAPLMDGDTPIGAISVLNRRGDEPFSDSDLKLLALVAGLVGREVVLQRERDEQEKEERLATIGRMLSGVLHDLKGPMSIISGYAQLTARKDDPKEREHNAQEVLDQCGRMGSLMKEVMAFARGESEILSRKVYLDNFCKDLEETLSRETEGRGVELSVELSDHGVAYFDETKLHRALTNLCRNGVEAMPEGGRLTVGVDRAEGDLVFRVSDTGQGIPPEIQDVLFDSFATAGKEDGTGLGLAIVKRIVDGHAGKVRYRTRPGRGTTFVIRLPQQKR